jgi:hypothetical protein
MPMDLAPRPTLDDSLIEGRPCFICGGHALHAVHLEGIPDYVSCSECQSAFVIDLTGDWLMYGKIHPDYPETRQVALRQWASPEDVIRTAREDRRLAAVELAAEPLPEPAEADDSSSLEEELAASAAEAEDRDASMLPALFANGPSLEAEDASVPNPVVTAPETEPEDLDASMLPALFATGPSLEAELPPHPESEGSLLEEPEGDLDDFSSRLAALAGVPIEDLLFDREDSLLDQDAAQGQDLPLPETGISVAGEASDDWLVLPEEPAPWQPPAEAVPPPHSLWDAAPPDRFVLPVAADLPSAPVAGPAQVTPREPAPPAVEPAAAQAPVPVPIAAGAATAEPPPGIRYRTVIRGTRVQFPRGACAHCMQSPARHRLRVRGSLPAGQVLGQRRATRFAIPLCSRCHKRARSRTPEERSARLQAYLISGLVALFVLIVTLLLDVVDLQGGDVVSGLLLLIILILGFAIPSVMLSSRANRFEPPEDALYVQTTLLVPEETQGLETAFEWRNRGYAERFLDSNQEAVLGRAIQVKDRSVLNG